MRIGLITDAFLPSIGGVQWKVHFLATEYQANGHEAVVFRPRLSRSEDKPLGIETTYPIVGAGWRPFRGYWRTGLRDLMITRSIMVAHRQRPFTALHCHSLELPSKWGTSAASKLNIPVVSTTVGYDIMVLPAIGYGARLDPALDRMVRQNVRMVEAVGSISRRVRRELEAMEGCAPILDIPNGVNWDSFQCGPGDWLRQRLRLSPQAVIILCLGSNRPAKDFPTAVRAFAIAAAGSPEAHLAVIGKDSNALAGLAAESGVSDRVHLMGNIPMGDVSLALWSSDIFLSSSVTEGFAQVVVQAMACARPCVLSDCSGNEDFSDSPFVVMGRAGDPVSLGAALSQLLAAPHRRAEMGKRAHDASRQYSWAAIAKKYLAVFQQISKTASRSR